MFAQVQTMPPAAFDTWVAGQLKGGADLGKQTFQGACGPCHGMTGKGLIGPPLVGNSTITQRKQLITLLENGKNAMPPVGRNWDPRQRDALIRYLQKTFINGR
jgi:mono/diheme cytochrome c family protein